MLKSKTYKVIVVFVLVAQLIPVHLRADSGRAFLMSCAYGTLAGTLVGAASLAFTDKPGDNLKSIARGASLGLYAGILLGLYVVYGVSDSDDSEYSEEVKYKLDNLYLPDIKPYASVKGIDGVEVSFPVLRF